MLNTLPKWIEVRKSPPSWRSKYYVVLPTYGRRYVVSHHKTKALAEAMARRLVRQYKSAKTVHSKYLGWGF